jgi:enoyl-CoA hydratase/carnithine racemase
MDLVRTVWRIDKIDRVNDYLQMARRRKDDPQPDWPAIYKDWLTGEQSNAQLARKYGLAPSSVNQKIAREKWTTTSGPVLNPTPIEPADEPTPKRRPDKPDVTKSLSTTQLRKRAKDLAQRLMAEVEDVTTYEHEIADIITIEESDPVRRRAAMKAISVDARIKNLRELTAILDAVDGKKTTKATESADKPEGKKAQRQEAAERAATSGVFAVPSPPKLVSSK